MRTLDRMLVQALPMVPKSWVGWLSARYIAGDSLAEAIKTVRHLNAHGLSATVDILGEFAKDLKEARNAVREYVEILQTFETQRLDSHASVKLTQLGLKLDVEECLRNMRELVLEANTRGTLITIDMEDSECTDDTLDIYSKLRVEHEHVGIVLQACLRRSMDDLARLMPLKPHIRICKGIYVEPSEIAIQDADEIRRQYLQLVDTMLAGSSFVGIATHDEVLTEACCELIRKHQATAKNYEFQMLLGVREKLRADLLRQGYPVRVYVPYGKQWYEYSVRRLKENPAIAGHLFRNMFRF